MYLRDKTEVYTDIQAMEVTVMPIMMTVSNFFEGMRANLADDNVRTEHKLRQRQLLGSAFILIVTWFVARGATWFFDVAADPKAPLAMFAAYRNTVDIVVAVVYRLLGAFALFCVYRIVRLHSQYEAS
jgi:hypothetical protein